MPRNFLFIPVLLFSLLLNACIAILGYPQEAGPGYACQSTPGGSQCAGYKVTPEAAALGVATIAVASEREEAVASCVASCGVNRYSIGCPAEKTPVCQCQEPPYARCSSVTRKKRR